MLLDQIKQKLLETYTKDDSKGLFFSAFDEKNNLLVSNGVLQTNKNIIELSEILYHAFLEKIPNIKYCVIDVVIEVQPQTDMQKLLTLSPKERGFFVTNKETNANGVLLPDTKGIEEIKAAIGLIKQKYNVAGNAEIFSFKTRRIVI